MAWPSTVLGPPNRDASQELSTTPGAVVTALQLWMVGFRIQNNGAGIAKINITNTAGDRRLIPTDYELAPGAIYPEQVILKPQLGIKGWADIVGVTFEDWGWS